MNRLSQFITFWLLALPFVATYSGIRDANALDKVVVIAADSFAKSIGAAQDMSMGQSSDRNLSMLPGQNGSTVENLYGVEGGYLHPYFSLEGGYTDNLYNVDSDKTSNFLTRVSPGIWFTLPRMKTIPITITPHNASPGGLQLQTDDYDGIDRFQLYALAGADWFFYSADSDANTEDFTLEGMGRYNMAGGLSFQLLNRYSLGHDGFGVGSSTEDNLREYENNLFMATADWDITEKVRIKIDYSNFNLTYADSINAFLERQDDVIDVYAYYGYSVKTSLFLQYRYVMVEYDSAVEKDNTQDYYYAGLRWDATEKISLLFKAGLQYKEYDDETPDFSDSDNFVVDLQANYRITEKTGVSLNLYRKNEESDNIEASEKVVFGARLGYTQRVTEKITGTFGVTYENADYTQLEASGREDDTFTFRPSVQYIFKEWLMAEAAYAYEARDSSDGLFDYESNTILFSLNFAL